MNNWTCMIFCSQGLLHRTLMWTDLSIGEILPKPTLSHNSSRGLCPPRIFDFLVNYLKLGRQGNICATKWPQEHGQISHGLSQWFCPGENGFGLLRLIECDRRAGRILPTSMWRWAGWTWVRCLQGWPGAPSLTDTSVSSESRWLVVIRIVSR